MIFETQYFHFFVQYMYLYQPKLLMIIKYQLNIYIDPQVDSFC